MTAIDTSIVIAAFAPWHEAHDIAVRACRRADALPAHAMLEAYASLTRLPDPFRVSATIAAEYLQAQWSAHVIAPSPTLLMQLPAALSAAGVSGGATYDALVALTAAEAGHDLMSLDRRAERTYRAVGVRFDLLATA